MARRLTVLAGVLSLTFSSATMLPAQASRISAAVWQDGAPGVARETRRVLAATPTEDSVVALLTSAAADLMWTGHAAAGHEALRLGLERYPNAWQLARLDSDLLIHLGRIDSAAGALEHATRARARSGAMPPADSSAWAERLRSLRHGARLVECNGLYRDAAGTLVLKFDPYRHTGTSLVDPATGTVHGLSLADSLTFVVQTGSSNRLSCEPGQAIVLQGDSGTRRLDRVPLRTREIRVPYAGAAVAGTLFLPADPRPAPAIVLAPGAGLATRYNVATEALVFAASGVAALAWDKPGLGESRLPDANWLLLSIEEQVRIVLAAVDALDGQADVDAGRIGAWGFSQGGWVVPLAASRSSAITFVVLVSAAAVGPIEQQIQWLTQEARARSLPDAAKAGLADYLERVARLFRSGVPVDSFAAHARRAASTTWGQELVRDPMGARLLWQPGAEWELAWWRANDVDPAAALRALEVPLLAIFGARDLRVPHADNLPIFARHTAELPDRAFVVVPDAGHQLTLAPTGRPGEQSTVTRYAPTYFGLMTDWIRDQTRRR